MSKFTRYATTTQSLSLAAMEEASRRGLRTADLDDLFLALVLDDQSAGRALRNLGITITSARAAVEAHHEEQLASLGITTELPVPGTIVFHETGGYEWSKRASDLIARSAGKRRTGDAAAVLRELLEEPSGLVEDLLRRLGTPPAAILEELDRSEPVRPDRRQRGPRRSGEITSSTGAFAFAPIEDVWALLADPGRIIEWEPAIGVVDETGQPPLPGMTWMGHTHTVRPDGKPLKVNEKFRRRRIELVEAEHGARIAWRFSWPDTDKARPVLTTFHLTPSTGGTEVTITRTWFGYHGWRFLVGTLLRPLQQFLLWISLFQIGSAISRAFRQP